MLKVMRGWCDVVVVVCDGDGNGDGNGDGRLKMMLKVMRGWREGMVGGGGGGDGVTLL